MSMNNQDSQAQGHNMEYMDGAPGQLEAFAKDAFHAFLKSYTVADQSQSQDEATQAPLYYAQQVGGMRLDDSTTLYVDWAHFNDYNGQIADMIVSKWYRLEPALRQAVLNFVKDVAPEYAQDDNGIDKEFFISVMSLGSTDRLRDLRVEKVGSLCCFAGTVTRSSEVRPELFQGAFKCLECSALVKGIEQQFKYTEPLICTNPTCGNRRQWSLVREDSVFVDWQRIKVQENVDEVPAGSLPRTLDVIVRNKQVEEAKAGDKAVFTGCLVVVPDVGSMALPSKVAVNTGGRGGGGGGEGFTSRAFGTREMTYRLMFIANSIQATDLRNGMVNIRPDEEQLPEEVLASYDNQHAQEVLAMKADPQVYLKMTHSICPSIWGHEQIKQAVLLMLLGGVHKKTPEGINLRGDINVAIVGDPACAKSQILKYVSGFLPRAIYTSGKASTAAGLTASVVKEPENGEFAIEAGALMLADNGVCCIDEFDKMDIKDQVAIHEAMEQQTISITKAGIQATLNARASILAAANPLGGRYDKAKPLKYNVALPPAILSRFDLLHVMIDETTEEIDNRIAQHIIRLHRYQGEAFASVHYSTEQLQRYIKYARAIKPELSQDAAIRLVHAYKELRSEDAVPGSSSAYRITVRQLEALVRLSEAVARAHCQHTITPAHVDDAKRLLRSSILKVEQRDVELDNNWDLGREPVNPEDLPNVDGPEPMDADGPGQENIQRNANGAADQPAAGVAGGKEKEGPGAAPGVPTKRAATKITAQKFTQMKGMLVERLMEAQEAAYRAQDAGGPDAPLEAGVEEGMKQEEIVTWYLNEQKNRGVLKLEEDMEQEMELLFKVINHLIKKDQVLAVVYRPEQKLGESPSDYLERVQTERVLTLHAGFNPDE